MKYEEPTMKIVAFDCSDVVCLSVGTGPDLGGEDWETETGMGL